MNAADISGDPGRRKLPLVASRYGVAGHHCALAAPANRVRPGVCTAPVGGNFPGLTKCLPAVCRRDLVRVRLPDRPFYQDPLFPTHWPRCRGRWVPGSVLCGSHSHVGALTPALIFCAGRKGPGAVPSDCWAARRPLWTRSLHRRPPGEGRPRRTDSSVRPGVRRPAVEGPE